MDAVQHTVVSSSTRAMDAQLSQHGGSDLARVGTGSVWVRVAPAHPEAPGAPEPATPEPMGEAAPVMPPPAPEKKEGVAFFLEQLKDPSQCALALLRSASLGPPHGLL